MTIRIGIIGCGALGRVHAKRFSAMSGVVVASLSDPNQNAVDSVAAMLPEPPEVRGTDCRSVLDANIDAVCIASPDSFHVKQVLDAFEAGLHILCEKPLTPHTKELDAVIAARERSGKHIAMTYPRRYDASIRRLREEILSGRWGAVRTVTAYNAEDWITPNRGTWRHDPAITPGGFFYDASGHQLDTICWVTGLGGRWITARTDNCGTPVPLKVWGHSELINGAPFTFCFVGDAHMWREQLNIHCEGTDFSLLNGRAYGMRDGTMASLAPAEEDETADECFIRLIRDGGPNWSPLEDIRPVIEFTQAALRSAEGDGAQVFISAAANGE